jgi:hypothetical protein
MRTTASRKPISVPVTSAKEFDKVQATQIVITQGQDNRHLLVRFDATDGDDVLSGHQFRVELDLDGEEGRTPRLTAALDRLYGILGRYYKRHHIQKELNEMDPEHPDYAALQVQRAVAESDLRAPMGN